MKSKTIVAAAALTVAVAAGAFAHGGATGIVKQRMDAMVAMGDVVKRLTPMMRGQVAYDADAVRKGAASIKQHADGMIELFPEGTGGPPSEARDDIWSDWQTFESLARQLDALASGLEAAAGNGLMMSSDSGSQNMMGGKNMMGGGGMMGGSSMGGNGMMGGVMPVPDQATLAAMPADGVFNMVAQTCSSCHTRFRVEKE